MIRKGKSKYQGTLESVDSSCDITISYQTMYYKNQTVSTYNTNWFL
jgi:small nuclear ribonucleoprotein (snRNP)-like protein